MRDLPINSITSNETIKIYQSFSGQESHLCYFHFHFSHMIFSRILAQISEILDADG